jgi:hypothetical protein
MRRVALIDTVPQRIVHITLAVRLIRYSTVRHRQCLQIDKVAVDQNALPEPIAHSNA